MMRERLCRANEDILRQVEIVQELIGSTRVCRELTAYVGRITEICAGLRAEVKRSLKDLSYDVSDTLIDVLDATQRVMMLFELLNSRLVSPIIRSRAEDRIGLLVLQWLHDSHAKTARLPFAVSDGPFSVYPSPEIPAVYLLPVSRQQTLLYLPLFFHEFGHLLYVCHKQELDDLVHDLQVVIRDRLAPVTIRNNRGPNRGDGFRQRMEARWFDWSQEFFCDAVGLAIGGPCYLKAFNHLFCIRSRDEYYLPRNDQLQRRHPVTWLRLKMLVDRARCWGLTSLADDVDNSWQDTARTLGVREDYEGTWSDEFFQPLRKMLDDMLEETQPVRWPCQPSGATTPPSDHPVELLNAAWERFEREPSSYRTWEKSAIKGYIESH